MRRGSARWRSSCCASRPELAQALAEPAQHPPPGVRRGLGPEGLCPRLVQEGVAAAGVDPNLGVRSSLRESRLQLLHVLPRDELVALPKDGEEGTAQVGHGVKGIARLLRQIE